MEKPEGYPETPKESKAIVGRSWFWQQGEENDTSFELSDKEDDYYYSFEDTEAGKLLLDPKLAALVDFLKELFLRRKELFRQLHDQVLEAAKKKGMRLWRVESGRNRVRVPTVARSLSLGSTQRNEWIKVTTINTVADGDPSGYLDGGVSASK